MYLNPFTWSSKIIPDKNHTVPTDKIYFPKNSFKEGQIINATLRVNNIGYNKTNLIIKSQFIYDKTLVGNKMTGYFYVETGVTTVQNDMRNRLVKLIEDSLPNDNHIYFIKDIKTMADHLIANDIVPVVRCENCKY